MRSKQSSAKTADRAALAEVALAFCKECLGWRNARFVKSLGSRYITDSADKGLADTPRRAYERRFHYTRLAQVLAQVEEWSEQTNRALLLNGAVDDKSPVSHFLADKHVVHCTLGTNDQCRTILSACLEAHRAQAERSQDG